MAKRTPEQVADKQIRNLSAATEDIRIGVENVTVSPTKKAADNIAKMKQKLIAAFDSGKVERGLRRVDLATWKGQMLNKGVPRIAAGVEASREKIVEFQRQLQPHEDALKVQIDKMPDVTLEDSIARANAWIRGMAKFRRK